jgi:4-diphosphocytidyl-2-C-methyl-D-erythritol kinase
MIIEKSVDGFRVMVPCKVNLFLEVLGKRPDGYHSLDTVMMAVSLVDELRIKRRQDSQLVLSVVFPDGSGNPIDNFDHAWSIPADSSNLIIRALERFRSRLRINQGADIELTKRIPAMAGLGGGSADCAAALVLGSLLWETESDFDQVQSLASELGSDINFFLEGGCDGFWLARCTGRGERIEPIRCKQPLHLVIIHPPRGCSTKMIFDQLKRHDPLHHDTLLSSDRLIEGLESGNLATVRGELFNRLEEPAKLTSDWIERSRMWLDRYDHHGQALSGSGSARFCLCRTAAEAEKIVIDIESHGEMRAFAVTTWQSPSVRMQMAQIQKSV